MSEHSVHTVHFPIKLAHQILIATMGIDVLMMPLKRPLYLKAKISLFDLVFFIKYIFIATCL